LIQVNPRASKAPIMLLSMKIQQHIPDAPDAPRNDGYAYGKRLDQAWSRVMGVGMQIAYLGFAGSSKIEAEAGAQLVRLDRFANRVAGCHLALEIRRGDSGSCSYTARLNLITRDYSMIPIERAMHSDPNEAVHAAFDAAVQLLDKRGPNAGEAE
jgi:hypothetical protein